MPSKVNIAVVSEKGEFMAAGMTQGRSFMTSCTVDDKIMRRGTYYFMIDASWNRESTFAKGYQKLTIGAICSGPVYFAEAEEGANKFIAQGIADGCRERCEDSMFKQVAPGVKRLGAFADDIIGLWYCVIYHRNESTRPFKCKLDFSRASGLEMMSPEKGAR